MQCVPLKTIYLFSIIAQIYAWPGYMNIYLEVMKQRWKYHDQNPTGTLKVDSVGLIVNGKNFDQEKYVAIFKKPLITYLIFISVIIMIFQSKVYDSFMIQPIVWWHRLEFWGMLCRF